MGIKEEEERERTVSVPWGERAANDQTLLIYTERRGGEERGERREERGERRGEERREQERAGESTVRSIRRKRCPKRQRDRTKTDEDEKKDSS